MKQSDKERFVWVGQFCTECHSTYEHSPSNYVSVDKFEYCPNCGTDSLEWREARIPLGGEIDKHLAGDD